MNQALIESILFKAIKNHEKQNFSEAEQLYEEVLKIHLIILAVLITLEQC